MEKKRKTNEERIKSGNGKVIERENRPKLGSALGLYLIEDEQQSEVVMPSGCLHCDADYCTLQRQTFLSSLIKPNGCIAELL